MNRSKLINEFTLMFLCKEYYYRNNNNINRLI